MLREKDQPLHVKISTPKAIETPTLEENEQPAEEPAQKNLFHQPYSKKSSKVGPKFTKPGLDNHVNQT